MLNDLDPIAISFSKFLSRQIGYDVVLVGMASTVVHKAKNPCSDTFQAIVIRVTIKWNDVTFVLHSLAKKSLSLLQVDHLVVEMTVEANQQVIP